MEEKAFRVYVTDGLKATLESWGGEVPSRYVDWLKPIKEETRTPEEVITSISAKLELLGEAQ